MRKALALILTVYAGMAQAGDVVIAALGDSLTQGYGLVQEEGFVPQLEAWLRAEGGKCAADQRRRVGRYHRGRAVAGGLDADARGRRDDRDAGRK